MVSDTTSVSSTTIRTSVSVRCRQIDRNMGRDHIPDRRPFAIKDPSFAQQLKTTLEVQSLEPRRRTNEKRLGRR